MIATLPPLAKLKPNPAWASLPLFGRKGWKRMAFGEFAESIGERAEPRDAQEEIYVGLEHLDPQCLHIRRWGKGSDVIGGKLRFRKGDIIFGKRRAYQRKLAVAEFGGICSAHAMVIRARPDKVLPEFLPFLMMSDRFMTRAVEISVGSLSPTINWTTLKLETFDLPPLDQQRRIAEILWAVDDTLRKTSEVGNCIEFLPQNFADHVTGLERLGRNRIQTRALGEIADVIDCKHRTPKPADAGVPVISPGTIKWGPLDLSSCRFTSESEHESLMDHCEVKEWDMVMGRNQTFGVLGVVQAGQRFVLGQDTVLIQPKTFNGQYIYLAMKSSYLRSQIDQLCIGSTFKRINLKDIRNLNIPLADTDMQTEAAMRVEQHYRLAEASRTNTVALEKLRTAMLNEIFRR